MKKKIENRFLRLVTLTALFLLGMVSFLQAQTTDSRFFQRLSWRGGENALRFEVVIEEEDEKGGYRELQQESTGDFFIEVSLPVGKYHFRVIPYDYRDRPGAATDWMNFEVRAVHKPELDNSLPAPGFVNRGASSELNIVGKNLAPDTDIYLQKDTNTTVYPTDVESRDDGNQVRLLFNNNQLTLGEYDLIIRNLNGMEATMKGIFFNISGQDGSNASAGQGGGSAAFGEVKPINVFLSAAWMPLIQISGNRNQNVSPAGAAVRLGVTSQKSAFFSIGAELAVSLLAFDAEPNKAALAAGTVNLNLLAQAWFPNRTNAFTLRVGGGPALLQDRPGAYINAGGSFLWLFQENFYAEIGLDAAYLSTNTASAYIRPWVGVGWQF